MALTASQIDELRERLLAERARLTKEHDSALSPLPESNTDVGDEMDAAQANLAQDDAAERSAHDRALLSEVELALGRIDAGTYGVSELSGDSIDYARLAAIPWARYTASEQEELEREARAQT